MRDLVFVVVVVVVVVVALLGSVSPVAATPSHAALTRSKSDSGDKEESVNAATFCESRPVGLYCSPAVRHQKIECPSGKTVTCPQGEQEMCQERGVLRRSGFRGGIARCVPRVAEDELRAFCDERSTGVYCFNNDQFNSNLRIQCPSGLLFKCDDRPSAQSKKCVQKSDVYAVCSSGGAINNGNCTLPPPITFWRTTTVTRTRTDTVTRTQTTTATRTDTLTTTDTVTRTRTDTITSTCTNTLPCVQTSFVTSTMVDLPPPITLTVVDPLTKVNTLASTLVLPVPTTAVSLLTSVNILSQPPVTTIVAQTSVITLSNNIPATSEQIVTVTSTPAPTSTRRRPVSQAPGGGEVDVTVTPTVVDPDTETVTVSRPKTTTDDNNSIRPTPSSVVVESTATTTTTSTTTSTSTAATGDGGCPSDGSIQLQLEAPPGSDFMYILSAHRDSETAGATRCKTVGGSLAHIDSTAEHLWVAQRICEPVWYRAWETNDYSEKYVQTDNNDCIALYPGGATAVPPGGCGADLVALCKVPLI